MGFRGTEGVAGSFALPRFPKFGGVGGKPYVKGLGIRERAVAALKAGDRKALYALKLEAERRKHISQGTLTNVLKICARGVAA